MNFVFLLNDKFFFSVCQPDNLTYRWCISVSGSINKYNLEVDIYELHPLILLSYSQFLIKLHYFFTYWALCICFVFSKTNMQHLFCYDYLLRYHFYKEVRGNFWKFDSSLAMNFFFIHFFPRQIKLSKKNWNWEESKK